MSFSDNGVIILFVIMILWMVLAFLAFITPVFTRGRHHHSEKYNPLKREKPFQQEGRI
jgi:hypothetical protein